MVLIAVAVLGACLVVAGVSLMFPPAGLVAAGLALIAAAYLIAEEGEA